MSSDVNANADSGAPLMGASAGILLRTAREANGMSIDAVAQQLKLAPRQVRALEEGDFTQLPGRTFVRGFIRNYARLVRLDAETVLGALPAGDVTPNLESPALHATAPTIGELPTTEPPKHGWTRWAIPLTLIAIIAATATWEWTHPAVDASRGAAKKVAPSTLEQERVNAPEVIGTPLPNPVAMPAPSAAAPEPTPLAPPPNTPPSGGPTPVDAPLMLAFRDFSWTEVKDRSGRVLLSGMNPGGTIQLLAGIPPLDVVIGNAADVTLTWKGERVDLALHTRQNVARLTLE
jgi:cytoskeleton protein RodZ